MSSQTAVSAAVAAPSSTEIDRLVRDASAAGPSHIRTLSYGTTRGSSQSPDGVSSRGKGLVPENSSGLVEFGEISEDESSHLIDVSWRYMSRLYLLVPIVTTFFLIGLFLLITFAWPPDSRKGRATQPYPHLFLWKPLLIGIFASCTVQTLRLPIWIILSFLDFSPTYLSTSLHTVLHELLRLSTLPLLPGPLVSAFRSSFYLGLGWGAAEAAWGIVQGWEQLALYEDLMLSEGSSDAEVQSRAQMDADDGLVSDPGTVDLETRDREDEADLERKVEVLERMRARRDLEQVIGIPFPNISLPLHILWRLDTLLLNLGLTLVLSAFYFNAVPTYRHDNEDRVYISAESEAESGRYLWLVWTLVAVLHIITSSMWKLVERVGIGAVIWGGLIVALGSLFAGLGAWGRLV